MVISNTSHGGNNPVRSILLIFMNIILITLKINIKKYAIPIGPAVLVHSEYKILRPSP